MTSSDQMDRALAAVPGYADLVAVETRLAAQREERRRVTAQALRAAAMRTLSDAVTTALATGKGLPRDLDEKATAAARAGEQLDATREVLATAARGLHDRRDGLLAEHIDAALDVLRADLADLIAEARPALDDLGPVRTAEAAVDAGPAAAAALRTVRAAGERYRRLREVHAELVHRAVAGTIPERDGGREVPRWGQHPDRVDAAGWRPRDAVADFGHVAAKDIQHPPADPVEMLVWLLRPGGPAVDVAGPAELRHRAEAATAARAPQAVGAPVRAIRPRTAVDVVDITTSDGAA